MHVHKKVFDVPDECIVCTEPFSNADFPFECGHWVHIDCIYKSLKSVCPICRGCIELTTTQQVQLDKHILKYSTPDTIEIGLAFSDILGVSVDVINNLAPFINQIEMRLLFEDIIDNNDDFNLPNTHRELILYEGYEDEGYEDEGYEDEGYEDEGYEDEGYEDEGDENEEDGIHIHVFTTYFYHMLNNF
jgi:hypothetical protein